jgi:predicted nucleic acid-binding protein
VIAPDTSIVVAALAPWHVTHEQARAALAVDRTALVAHVAVETTSALSRMPERQRIAPGVVLSALRSAFTGAWLSLPGNGVQEALERAASAGVRGGALYDALIAATAAAHGATLITADRRASVSYEAMGAAFTLVHQGHGSGS